MAWLESGPMVIIILAIILLFGATAIPKLARSLGRAKGEFSKAKSEFDSELAGAAASATSPGASEAQVRQAARNLGIEESRMTLDEVKRELNQRLS